MKSPNHFIINDLGKAEVTVELETIKLPSGTYFLDKEFIEQSKRKYTVDDLRNGSLYNVYKGINIEEGDKSGLASRVTDQDTLRNIMVEIKKNKSNIKV